MRRKLDIVRIRLGGSARHSIKDLKKVREEEDGEARWPEVDRGSAYAEEPRSLTSGASLKVGRACWTSERSFESKGWSRRTGQRRSGRDPEAVEPGRKDVGIRRLRRTITGCEDLQTIYKSDGSIDDFGFINQAKTGEIAIANVLHVNTCWD